MATEAIALEELPSQAQGDSLWRCSNRNNSTPLPPTDHGKAAYLVLTGCALAQIPVWGYSLAWGIFQQHYTTVLTSSSPSAINSIGTTQNGIMYLIMPLSSIILTRFPHLRSRCAPLGLVILVSSLVASAFNETNIGALIATQGVLYAIGCGLIFCPTSLYLDDWFVEKKGTALGIMWAAKAATGVVTPFLMDALIREFGIRATVLSWAIASALLTLPLLFLLKPRLPLERSPAAPGERHAPLSFAFMRHPIFWLLELGNVLQSLGYLMPSTYLASYAASLGLPSINGPVVLALFSLASVPGALVFGMLGDCFSRSTSRFSPITAILISSVGSALAVFCLWGFSAASQVTVLAIFSIAYGFFAGGFSSTWSSVLHEMRHQDSDSDTGLLFAFLMGGRGVGFVLSGPISGLLLTLPVAASSHTYASGGGDHSSYASTYGPMIICTGVTAILGGSGWLWTLGKLVKQGMARLRSCRNSGRSLAVRED